MRSARRILSAILIWSAIVLDLLDIGDVWKFASYLTIWGVLSNGGFFLTLVVKTFGQSDDRTLPDWLIRWGEFCVILELMITSLYWSFGTHEFMGLPNAFEKIIGIFNHLVVFLLIALETFIISDTARYYTFNKKDIIWFLPMVLLYICAHLFYLCNHNDYLYPQINNTLRVKDFIVIFCALSVYFLVCFETVYLLHQTILYKM